MRPRGFLPPAAASVCLCSLLPVGGGPSPAFNPPRVECGALLATRSKLVLAPPLAAHQSRRHNELLTCQEPPLPRPPPVEHGPGPPGPPVRSCSWIRGWRRSHGNIVQRVISGDSGRKRRPQGVELEFGAMTLLFRTLPVNYSDLVTHTWRV